MTIEVYNRPYFADFDEWVRERWAAGQQQPHPVPFPIVAALGLAGETGEVLEHLKKHIRDGKHPGFALRLELGDQLHYLTVIANAYGWTLADLAQTNVEKLNARDDEKRRQQ